MQSVCHIEFTPHGFIYNYLLQKRLEKVLRLNTAREYRIKIFFEDNFSYTSENLTGPYLMDVTKAIKDCHNLTGDTVTSHNKQHLITISLALRLYIFASLKCPISLSHNTIVP